MREVQIDGATLDPEAVEAVARGRAGAHLTEDSRGLLQAGADWYARHGDPQTLRARWVWLVGGEVPESSDRAVRAFVEGHCAGVGEPLPVEEVRAMLLVRANALAVGWSGVRPEVVDRLLTLLALGWTPVVPSIGALGAAGSIQLAHVARVALGLGGQLTVEGLTVDAAPRIATLPPLRPTEKEALSLLNGSSYATALAALAVARARRVLRAAEAACALSMEVVRADPSALTARAAEARNHPGITVATRRLRELVTGSELVTAGRSPDSFSVRCAPAVLGAARDALDHVATIVGRELNAASDNPLVFPGHGVVEGGHFHGAPVALAMDHLKVAMVQLGSIAERRVFRLTYGRLSGLPSFLVPGSGVNSGLMLAQYTAASLLSEAKTSAMPASVDSIPTVQHHEDHVPMAAIAARSALEVVDRIADIVAIELLCGAQGLEFRMDGRAVDDEGRPVDVEPLGPGPRTRKIWEKVRARVKRWDDDQVLHPDLVALGAAVREGAFD